MGRINETGEPKKRFVLFLLHKQKTIINGVWVPGVLNLLIFSKGRR